MSGATLVRLGDLGDWSGGNTPSKANPEYWGAGSIPWVSPKDMKVDEIGSSEDSISDSAVKDGRASILPSGTVLVVARSGILAHTLPVAVTTVPVTINQDLKALTPHGGVSPKYVAHALRGASRRILKQCSKHGTTVASVETKALLDFEIPIVSFDEQLRVVAEIEKQFSRLDQAVANLQRAKANLKRYKASVLKAALEGRLVETEASIAHRECRAFESGEQLLRRVAGVRRSEWKGRGQYQEPPSAKTDGLSALPTGWTWATMPQLGELARGKSKHRPRDDAALYGGPYPFIQTGDVRRSGGSITEASQSYSEIGLKQSRLWPAGTLCITIAANIAETGILKLAACFPDSVVGFLPAVAGPTTEFVQYFVMTAKDELNRFAPATAQKNINLEVLEMTALPLPPLDEQARIVAEVDRRLSILREVEAEVDVNLKRVQSMRQAILGKAFSASPA